MTSPVQRLVVGAVESGQDAWYGYVDLRGVRGENERLRAENLHIRSESARTAEIEAENGRLRVLAAYIEAQAALTLVAAPVIAFGSVATHRSIRIGRGLDGGVKAGMAVITPDGVVGRVVQAYDSVADVLLVTDKTSAVAVESQRTRARATARGTGESARVALHFVEQTRDLQDGDVLVTAASGVFFPKGLRVGRATRVENPDHALFKTADIAPSVDFSRLEEVLVVVDGSPEASLQMPAGRMPQ